MDSMPNELGCPYLAAGEIRIKGVEAFVTAL